ncbi:hypothetical protein DRQ26_03745, partial [bacterium]
MKITSTKEFRCNMIILLVIISFFVCGADVVFQLDNYNIPPDFDETWDMVVADFNGDGEDDIFCANEGSASRLYLNEGDTDGDGVPNFAEHSDMLPFIEDGAHCACSFDINGDGLADIIVGELQHWGAGGRQNLLLLNCGDHFEDVSSNWEQPEIFSTMALSACDIDCDGDTDIISGNGFVDCKAEAGDQWLKERNCIYLNVGDTDFDGVDNFIDPYDNPLLRHNVWDRQDRTYNTAVGDIDGNGYPDIVFANYADTNYIDTIQIYLNQGDTDFDGVPNFFCATDSLLPEIIDTLRVRCVNIGDFDYDGDADLFLLVNRGKNRLYFYDETAGKFTDVTDTNLPSIRDMMWESYTIDLNNDGFVDIFISADQNHILVNDGAGVFTDSTDEKLIEACFSSIGTSFLDVDGDGDFDILCGDTYEQNRFQLNDGSGKFLDITTARAVPDAEYTEDIALADIDSDGDMDIILANRHKKDRIYINDGSGFFSDETWRISPIDETTKRIVAEDLTGDGWIDIFFVYNGGARFLVNLGGGIFSDSTGSCIPSSLPGPHLGVVALDVELDGDLDLFISSCSVFPLLFRNRLLLNDGSGHFTDVSESALPDVRWSFLRCDAGDVNGDGYREIVV